VEHGFLTSSDGTSQSKVYRDEIVKFLIPTDKKVDYTMSLVYQMFESSCDREPMYVTVSIQKLVYIWNLLATNKESICLKGSRDPLRSIINELGGETITEKRLEGSINL